MLFKDLFYPFAVLIFIIFVQSKTWNSFDFLRNTYIFFFWKFQYDLSDINAADEMLVQKKFYCRGKCTKLNEICATCGINACNNLTCTHQTPGVCTKECDSQNAGCICENGFVRDMYGECVTVDKCTVVHFDFILMRYNKNSYIIFRFSCCSKLIYVKWQSQMAWYIRYLFLLARNWTSLSNFTDVFAKIIVGMCKKYSK